MSRIVWAYIVDSGSEAFLTWQNNINLIFSNLHKCVLPPSNIFAMNQLVMTGREFRHILYFLCTWSIVTLIDSRMVRLAFILMRKLLRSRIVFAR